MRAARRHTRQAVAAEVKRIEELLEALKGSCEVVGGTALLSLDTEIRDSLVDGLGEATADAIAVAKERGAILWTDDLTTAMLAAEHLQVPRVWTQPVLRKARDQRAISSQEMLDANGKLLSLGYSFTGVNAHDIVRLIGSVGWSLDKGVGAVVYRQACEVGVRTLQNCVVYAFALAGIWVACPSEKEAGRLICRLLDGMGRAMSGPLIARHLHRSRYPIAGMTYPKMRRFRRMLRKWRSR
jgi:predicted nucleic acid-binding protein